MDLQLTPEENEELMALLTGHAIRLPWRVFRIDGRPDLGIWARWGTGFWDTGGEMSVPEIAKWILAAERERWDTTQVGPAE